MTGVCGEKKGTVEAWLPFVGKRKGQLRRGWRLWGKERDNWGAAGVCREKKGTVKAWLAFVGKRKGQLRRGWRLWGKERDSWGALPWRSLAGKRGSCRYPCTGFSENVLSTATRYEMLEGLSYSARERALPLSIQITVLKDKISIGNNLTCSDIWHNCYT